MPQRRSAPAIAGLVLVPLGAALLSGQAPSPVRDTTMINRSTDPLLASFRFRSIGPASMGGRIDDIEVRAERSEHHLRRLRAGGVFKSTTTARRSSRSSRRTAARRSATSRSIRPIPTSSTSAPAKRTIGRRRRSATGSTRPTDGGKTFTNIGLRETQTIARIVIDPKQSGSRLRRIAGTSVRPEPRPRHLQDDRRRQDLDQDQVHRREHRLHRHRDRSVELAVLYAASYQRRRTRLLLQRRRSGQRALEDDNAGQTWRQLYGRMAARRHVRAASRSTCRGRTRTWSTRRSRSGATPRPRRRRVSPSRRRGLARRRVVGGGGRRWAGGTTGATTPVRDAASAAGAVARWRRRSTRRPHTAGARRRRARASSAPTTRARSWHASSATATRGRSTSASFASIRATTRTILRRGRAHGAKSLDGGKTFLALDDAGGSSTWA